MTFKTGSITSATPAKALFDLLDADLDAVGYVRVETGLASGGVTWTVYRSPAAANFFGQDWYFALGYDPSTMTSLYSCLFEDWDATNKLAVRFAPSTNGLVPAAGYTNPQAPSALPAGFLLAHLFPTTAFTYAYSVLIDRVAIGSWAAGATRFGWYIGLYDSFFSTTDDPLPLVICQIGGYNNGSSQVGASTREPMTTSANSGNFWVVQGWANSNAGDTFHLWNFSHTGNSYQGGRPWVSRVRFTGRGGSTGFARGLFRDLFAGPNASPYQTNGDRITWTAGGVNYAGVVLRGAFTTIAPVLIPEY